MTDNKSSESRRKLLKSIAAGSGVIVAGKSLPDTWTKPVVDSVLLPVHAQTSNDIIYSSNNVAVGMNDQINENSLLASLSRHLVPSAEAQAAAPIIGCAKTVGSMLEFEILDLRGGYRFAGQLPLDKSTAYPNFESCQQTPDDTTPMAIISINDEEVVIATEEPVYIIPYATSCVVVPPLVCG